MEERERRELRIQRESGFWDRQYYQRIARKRSLKLDASQWIGSGGTAEVFRLIHRNALVVKVVDTRMIDPPLRRKICEHCEFEINRMPTLQRQSPYIMPLLNRHFCENCPDKTSLQCIDCPLLEGHAVPRLLLKSSDQEDAYCRIYFLVMPKLQPLNRYIRTHPLTEAELLVLGMHICDALQTCYDFSVFHRDVKPDNIFLRNKDGCISYILGDFGIARPFTNDLLTGFGTYVYCAPEVLGGCGRPNSDLYSLGVTLYELAGGRFTDPQPGPHPIGHWNSHLRWEHFVTQGRGSDGFRRILERALMSYQDRYQTPAEMHRDLEMLYRHQFSRNE